MNLDNETKQKLFEYFGQEHGTMLMDGDFWEIDQILKSQADVVVKTKIAEQLNIANKALYKISFETEDMFPPYRNMPASRMAEIAQEAVSDIKGLSK